MTLQRPEPLKLCWASMEGTEFWAVATEQEASGAPLDLRDSQEQEQIERPCGQGPT